MSRRTVGRNARGRPAVALQPHETYDVVEMRGAQAVVEVRGKTVAEIAADRLEAIISDATLDARFREGLQILRDAALGGYSLEPTTTRRGA